MGTIKIELDLPEFKKEIELKIVINKDGVQQGTPLVYKQVDNVQVPVSPSSPVWKDTGDPSGGTPKYNNQYNVSRDNMNNTTVTNKNSVQSANTPGIVSSMTGTY